jgi:hypothetical protein
VNAPKGGDLKVIDGETVANFRYEHSHNYRHYQSNLFLALIILKNFDKELPEYKPLITSDLQALVKLLKALDERMTEEMKATNDKVNDKRSDDKEKRIAFDAKD